MNIIGTQTGEKQKGMEANGDLEEAQRRTAQWTKGLEVEGESERGPKKE